MNWFKCKIEANMYRPQNLKESTFSDKNVIDRFLQDQQFSAGMKTGQLGGLYYKMDGHEARLFLVSPVHQSLLL